MNSKYKIKHNKFFFINDTLPHSGSFNMEFDSWLFSLLNEKKLSRVFRIYEWQAPTITYGKFQKLDQYIDLPQCNKDNIELIKRPTGGRAILHYNEITFSFVFTADTISPYDFRNSFLLSADIIVKLFEELNIQAQINLSANKYNDKTLCFQSISQYEIIDSTHKKLTGIAQLFTPQGVLIQGSIPLTDNVEYNKYFKLKTTHSFTNELIKKNLTLNEVRNAFIKGAGKVLKLEPFF